MRRSDALNLLLFAGFLALLSFAKLPRILHEIIGTLMLLGIGMHLLYAKGWLRRVARGRWDIRRALTTGLNALLAVTVLIVLVTGIIVSNHLFTGIIPIELHRSLTLRQLHTALGWLTAILVGLHIGLHGRMLWQRLVRSLGIDTYHASVRLVCGILTLAMLGIGVYASVLNRVGDRLRMEHIFATEATALPGALFVLLLASMMGMYALVGSWLMQLVQRCLQK